MCPGNASGRRRRASTRRAACAAELAARRDGVADRLKAHIEAGYFEPPPDNATLGPTAPRGRLNGLILRGERIVASWGDTRRVDMTSAWRRATCRCLPESPWPTA
jgi:hypothetical protein